MTELPPGTNAIVDAAIEENAQSLFGAADVPLLQAEDLLAAIQGPAMRDLLAMRIEQIVKHGHTTENDAMLPLLWLPRQVRDHAQTACDRIGVTGKDRNLDKARLSLARCAALCMAAMDRISAAIEAGEK